MPLVRRRFLQLAAGTVASPALIGLARAQAYPARPVRMIVPVAAGGANDTASRLVAQKLSESFGQQFIVENHPGGGGNIGMQVAAKAAPDGYSLLAAASTFVINPALYAKIPYDPFKDFTPVSLMCFTTHVVVVNPSVPANNIMDLVALIRANPGKYSYGSAGTGTPAHLAGELFRSSFGLDLTHVPFQGGSQAMTSTIGGHTPIAFSALSTAATNVKAGQVRALAITSTRRSTILPDIPTMAESGAPGREADVISGILVPTGTPQSIIDALHREISKAMTSQDVLDRLDTLGFVTVNRTPAEFADWIKEEVAKWQKVIRDAHIQTR